MPRPSSTTSTQSDPRVTADREQRRRLPRVLHDVRQRLLQHPEGVDPHARGDGLAQVALVAKGHRHARRFDLRDERIEVGRSRSRCVQTLCVALFAQHAEHPSHLLQRLAARRLDRGERLARFVRVRVDHVRADSGLHCDDAHRVRDDVVQLLRDAPPLVDDRLVRLALTIDFEQRGTLLEAREVLPASRHALAEHPRRGEDRPVLERLPGVELGGADQPEDEDDPEHVREPEQRLQPLAVRTDGVDREEQRGRGSGHVVVEAREDRDRRRREHEAREWMRAAEQEGETGRRQDRADERRHVLVLRVGLRDHRDRDHDDGERPRASRRPTWGRGPEGDGSAAAARSQSPLYGDALARTSASGWTRASSSRRT